MVVGIDRLASEGMALLEWLLSQLGIAGVVSAGVVVTVLGFLYYGYKMAWAISLAKDILRYGVRHVVVSTLVVATVVVGGIHLGVIQGIDLGALLEAIRGVTN